MMPERLFLEPRDLAIRRLEFHLVTRCGCRCAFCSEADRMAAFSREGFSFDEASALLTRCRGQGFNHLNLTGGEPTLFARLPDLLGLAKALGYTTYLATNGLRTRQERYFATLAPSLDQLCLSLHGARTATHDGLTGIAGSFKGLMATLNHARARRMALYANTVATTANLPELPAVAAIARTAGFMGLLISAVAPEGRGREHYARLALPLGRWSEVARDVVREAGDGVNVRFFGLPLCLLGEHHALSNDLYFDPRMTVERVRLPSGKAGLVAVRAQRPSRERSHPPVCDGCRYRGVCAGVFAHHLAMFPDDLTALSPVYAR